MTRLELEQWLKERIAQQVGSKPDEIDPRDPFSLSGIDSKGAAAIASELQNVLHRPLDIALLFEYPTIETLAAFLTDGKPAPKIVAAAQEADDVAIVGMACRLPGAHGVAALWELLRGGIDAIGEIPAERWGADATAPRTAGALEPIDGFDARFFGILAPEAATMDPQQRLVLELAWEALEDAGQPASSLAGSATGVFLGASTNEYARQTFAARNLSGYEATGSALSVLAARVSYQLDLRGPSLAVDTACSSSLVAVAMACRSLRAGESTLALAGGVNLLVSPELSGVLATAGMLAPDGRCKTFDARANGYVRGEGGAVLVLKPLERAREDGDRIYAVVRGAAINQDGRTNGLTAPSPHAQESVLRAAYQSAGVAPGEIQYVEAHGTGTLLGDPIEAKAIGEIVGKAPGRTSPCLVGSVKTNIGHLEAAAGVAGLMKTALALHHRAIPKSLHFENPNPHIPFGELGLEVARELTPWPSAQRRLAGVSSFGFGGTNAHIVLEAAPAKAARPAAAPIRVLALSARDPNALNELCTGYQRLLQSETRIDDICYTAAARRSHHDVRLAVTGRTALELSEALRAPLAAGEVRKGHRPRIAFAFSGQGSQWAKMGLQTYATNPVFAATLRRCDSVVQSLAGWSVLEELGRDAADSRLANTAIAQPVITSLQLALCEMYRAWGIVPAAVVGHSVGEIAAACVAGVVELEECLRIAVVRGKAMANAGPGRMLAVELPEAEAAQRADREKPKVCVAAVNSPSSTVLAGDAAALATLRNELEADGVPARWLDVDYAFHSPQMETVQPGLLADLKFLAPRPPGIPMYSTLTGARSTVFDAPYWTRAVREPVRFAAAVHAMAEDGCDIILEIGGHPVLTPAMQRTVKTARVIPSLRREKDEETALASSVAALYAAGATIDWNGIYSEGGEHLDVPTYPWQRQRFWIAPTQQRAAARNASLLGSSIALAGEPATLVFSNEIDETLAPYLADYMLEGDVTLSPGVVLHLMMEAAKRAVPEMTGAGGVQLPALLPFDNLTPSEIQVRVETPKKGAASVQVHGRFLGDDDWISLGAATVETSNQPTRQPDSLAEIQFRCLEQIAPPELYRALREAGVSYGLSLRQVVDVWRQDGEALTRVRLSKRKPGDDSPDGTLREVFHGVLQSVAAALPRAAFERALLVPAAIERFRIFRKVPASMRVHAVLRSSSDDAPIADVTILDEEGASIAEIDGLSLRAAVSGRRETKTAARTSATWSYRVEWRPKPAGAPATNAQGRWILIENRSELGLHLARTLEGQGGQCVRVAAADAAGIERALSESAEVRGIVHLGPLDAHDAQGAQSACESTLALLRTIGDHGLARSPRLWLVTQGAQGAANHAATAPFQAPIWGLAKAITFEQPDLRCTKIDLDPARGLDAAADLAGELLVEDDEDQRILRDQIRMVPRLVAHAMAGTAPSFRADATYLITGGLGGLGLLLARWFVLQGARHIALIGRRAPQDHAQEVVRELERSGARVVTLRADVANRNELAEALLTIERQMPPLAGIVHAAGTRDDGALLNLDPERLAQVLRPKVHGAWNLHELTEKSALDFFVLFSSAASVLGSPGQANYMAANAFLDALAHHRHAQGKPALSINWGPWAEVGMASSLEDAFRASGIGMIGSADGVDAFARLLGDSISQATIMPVDLATLFHLYPVVSGMSFFSELYGDEIGDVRNLGTAGRLDKRQIDAELVAPRTETEAVIAGIWQRALGLDRIGIRDDFFALGGDSIFAAQIIIQVQKRFGITIDAQAMFEKLTIEAMANMVEQLILAQITAMNEPEVEAELARAQG